VIANARPTTVEVDRSGRATGVTLVPDRKIYFQPSEIRDRLGLHLTVPSRNSLAAEAVRDCVAAAGVGDRWGAVPFPTKEGVVGLG
jgi:hypothetical protein